MLIIPAIDLKEGKCVRLEQGLMDKATVYSDDPATTARHWESQGAEFLHVVDLDGAFAGKPKNLDAIKAIRAAIKIPIEVGGGIRDMATIRTLVSIGINRIILGTAAIENPSFVQEACGEFPGRIIVGIDAKEGMVAIKGWALHIPVIASGGVHTMKDIEGLLVVRHSGISGVITGKAIYSGSLNLKEAITFVKMNDNQCSR
jgi:phosphoribosylformimino-5-aminoimidazole carboxamide ribotide isomerase